MKSIVIIMFLVSGVFSYSQEYSGALEIAGNQVSTDLDVMKGKFDYRKGLIGSEYLYKDFKKADITSNSDELISLKVRFNVYNQEFEFFHKGDTLALKRDMVGKVDIEGAVFKPILDEKHNPIYAKELVNGKISLFKKYKTLIKKSKIIEGIQTETPKDRIVIRESYIIKKSDSEKISMIKLKKKSILTVLNNEKKIINFVKENKFSYKKENDVIKIFTFFNEF